MPDKHARLACSASDRWIHCPASIHLSEEYCGEKEDTGSVYAAEGTEAHSLAEWKLHKYILKDTRKRKPKLSMIDSEMEEATDFYRDQVAEILQGAGEGARLMVEQEFNLEDYIPGGFGTSDAVVISDDTLHVIDLKYGKGVQVDAPNNSQLRCYALGTLGLFESLYAFKNVCTHIIQPRLDHISEETISVEELKKWGAEVLKPAADKAANNSDEQAAGDWCRFCPVAASCRERAQESVISALEDFADDDGRPNKKPDMLTDEEMGQLLTKALALQKWIESAKSYAQSKIEQGGEVPGWKLVEGRSLRKYKDDIAVEKKLEEAGYDRAVITETKLLSVSAMEKFLGKKTFKELCGDLVEKPAGKPMLVPESDKRQALSFITAEEDFKEEK